MTKIKNGDIFNLNNHRVMCGDCNDENIGSDVEVLMQAEKVKLVVADTSSNKMKWWDLIQPHLTKDHNCYLWNSLCKDDLLPVVSTCRIINMICSKNDIIYDPHLNTGNVLIASESSECRCFAIEQSPDHIEASINRYIEHCSKNNKPVVLNHLNGDLTLNDFE